MAIYRGDKEIVGLYKGPTEIIKRYKGSNLIYNVFKWLPYSYEHIYNSLVPQYMNKSKIPEEYQEVEYIESTGTQYIDTTLNLGANDFTIQCDFTEAEYTASEQALFSIWTVDYGYWNCFIHSNHQLDVYLRTHVYNQTIIEVNKRYSVSLVRASNNWTLSVNNSTVDYAFTPDQINPTTLKLFTRGDTPDTSYSNTKIKMYHCKIYVSGLLTLDLIPCYRKSDNVIGLYDKVNNTFYTNAGTGTFLKGADVKRAVKDKAQVNAIYGNSVVENQLIAESSPHPCYQSWTIDNSQGTSTSFAAHQWNCDSSIRLTIGHKYLIWFSGTKSYSGNGACRLYINVANKQVYVFDFKTQNANIITVDSIESPESLPTLNTILGAGAVLTVDGYLCFADLTQWFPFNTPTTLTDTRVQEIINRGHILYNAGTLKNVDIGEISSEPYNLFDEALEIGSIRQDNGQNNDNITSVSRSKNYIKVVPGYSYTLEYPTTANLIIYEYDENKGYIESYSTGSTTSFSITLTNITRYVRFAIGNNDITAKVCFHVTGIRTGYAPHTQPYTLPFKYQGSGVGTAYDTLEITDIEYVFTKVMNEYTFTGNETWVAEAQQYYTTLPIKEYIKGGATSYIGNVICCCLTPTKQTALYQGTADNGIAVGSASQTKIITVRSSTNITSPQTASSYMTGKNIKYELATPQVVRIPKKHLAVVDMGTMTWGKMPNGRMTSESLKDIIKKHTKYEGYPNLRCAKYTIDTPYNLEHTPTDKTISNGGNGYAIAIYDSDYADATAFKQAMSGVYLFYETEDEVDDILFDINIEAGGSITSNWVSLVENQLVSPFDNTGWTSSVGTYAMVDSRKATITLTTNTGSSYSTLLRVYINGSAYTNIVPPNHKALVYFKLTSTKTSNGSNAVYIGNGDYRFNFTIANGINHICGIINYTGSDTSANSVISLDLTNTNYQVGDVITIEDYELIDLTLGFGAGKEPTSIDDPRIQYILKQGYIPTNTIGTNKSVASEVLPNIDFKIKCR